MATGAGPAARERHGGAQRAAARQHQLSLPGLDGELGPGALDGRGGGARGVRRLQGAHRPAQAEPLDGGGRRLHHPPLAPN